MVNLPEFPRRLALTEEPKSSFGAGDINSAYGSLAHGLDSLSEGLDKVAVRGAEELGRDAVSIGEDGKPQVAQAPLVGPAAEAYARSARYASMTKADADADRALIDLRDRFKDDPAGYLKAAKSFQSQHLSDWSFAGTAVRESLKRAMETRTTGIYSGLVSENETRGIQTAKLSIDARLKTLGDDLETLYRRGGGTNDAGDMTPQAKDLWDNIHALYGEKSSNPLYRYPKEVASGELDALTTRVQGAAVLEKMEQVYQSPKGGRDAALLFLHGSVRDLDGKVKQLDKIQAAGRSWISSQEALYRGDREGIRRDWSALKGAKELGSPEMYHDLEARALEVGDHKTALDISTTRSALDVQNYFRTLSPQEQVDIAKSGVVPPPKSDVDPIITAAAQKYGVDPELAIRFAHIESSRNPTKQKGKYKGLFMLDDEEFKLNGGTGNIFDAAANADAAMKKIAAESTDFKAKYGRDPQAWELYLTHQQGVGGFAAHSKNPDGVAWQNMASTLDGRTKGEKWSKEAIWGNLTEADQKRFGSVDNVTSQQFMDVWRARAGGMVSSVNLGDSRTGFKSLQMLRDDIKKDIPNRLTVLQQQFDRGQLPEAQDLLDVGAMIGVVGTPEQRRKVAEYAAMKEHGTNFQQMTAPERAAAISSWDEHMKNGGAEAEGRLVDYLRKADHSITAAYKDSRWDAFPRFSKADNAKPTPPMNFGDAPQMAAVAKFRLDQDKIIKQEQGLGPGSIFRPSEATNFGGALAAADGKQTKGLFDFLLGLPDETLGATLADDKVREAISGAARSTDTAKYTASMSAMDAIYARDPHRFGKLFGADAVHALADWQNNARYLDQKSLADERRQANDPAAVKARDHWRTTGRDVAQKVSPDDVTKKFDQSWTVTPGFIARATGSQPLPPVDEITQSALMGDYATEYSRAYRGDKDAADRAAVKVLGTQWKRSAVNGGVLMRDAPEMHYPAVDGSHDWMQPQIKADIEKKLGIQQDVPQAGATLLPLSVAGFRNFDYQLVSDRQTQTEGQRYNNGQPAGDDNKPPTYRLVVRDNRRADPKWDVLYAESGQPLRYQFDPNVATSRDEAKFGAGRARNEKFLAEHNAPDAQAMRSALPTPPPAEFRNRSEAPH